MLPTPAILGWSSRKDFSGAVRPAAISPRASGVNSGAKGSTPSLAKRSSSFSSASRNASPKRRGSVNQSSRPSSRTKRARRCRSSVERSLSYRRRPSEGSSTSSPSRRIRLPVIRRCMTSVRPPSRCTRMYLPRRPSRSIVLPETASPSCSGGTGRDQLGSSTSSRSIRCPSTSGSSCLTTVSTSGSSGIPEFYLLGGAGVRLEVDLLEAFAREVRVHLGRRDVGVTEHLLHGAKVAAAGEQVGGEAVAQRVRAHLAGEAGVARVALDDLVEPLAGQRPAAEVDEQLRLVAVADQLRPAAAQIAVDRRDRLPAERHQAFLRALAAGAEEALAQVDVAQLQPDRLRSAQPAGVHHLQQGPVAQRRRLAPLRRGEQLLHLGVVENVRQFLRPARGAEVGGRVVADQLVAAQVLVEGAQAGGLAVDGRGGEGRAPLPRRQLGEEVGDVGAARLQRVAVVGAEVFAVLEQIGPVGVEGVAREAALQLQVGEEVEDEALEAGVGAGLGGRARRLRLYRDGHGAGFSPRIYKPLRARKVPAASGAAKNSGSCSRSRPIVLRGSPEEA